MTTSVKMCPVLDRAEAGRTARGRPSHALASSFREVEPLLMSISIRLCRDVSDANDLVQDTFERALRFAGTEPVRNPRSWLVTILHHLFIDRCRAVTRQPPLMSLHEDDVAATGDPPHEPQPEWSLLTLADVRGALEDLEPALRRTYEMHVFEQRSYREISASMGIPRATVGTRLNRARRRLRDALRRELALRGVRSARLAGSPGRARRPSRG